MTEPILSPSKTAGSLVEMEGPAGPACRFHLEIPAGPAGRYRLAQVDDYHYQRREDYPWRWPARLSLRARVSHRIIPGTWGFGLWNDPFSMSILGGEGARRLPCLPNCAWFFFAAPPNWLSLRDDLPGAGLLAATFSSSWAGNAPNPVSMGTRLVNKARLLAALPMLALLPGGGGASLHSVRAGLRGAIGRIVQQDTALIPIDPTAWHNYQMDWQEGAVNFIVDGERLLVSSIAPAGPLGCVVWVDNQYAAFPPNGRVRYGMLENQEPAWLEIEGLEMETG
jgi:hypothetical protein